MKKKIAMVGCRNEMTTELLGALSLMGGFSPMIQSTKRFSGAIPLIRPRKNKHEELQACARRRRQIERGILKKENGLVRAL